MRILTVFSHPYRDRYPGAVMDAFHLPFREARHEIDVLDLDAEGFDPHFTREDHVHFWGGPIPSDIARMHHRVEQADRLAFVFPVYWWGMPALMKGCIERVFTPGWVYQYGEGVNDRGKAAVAGLLPNVPTLLLGIGGSKTGTYEKYGYDVAMRTQIDVGTFAYCGIRDVESHLITDIEGDHNAQNRADGLLYAFALAESFLAPSRRKRDAKEEHLASDRPTALKTAEKNT